MKLYIWFPLYSSSDYSARYVMAVAESQERAIDLIAKRCKALGDLREYLEQSKPTIHEIDKEFAAWDIEE